MKKCNNRYIQNNLSVMLLNYKRLAGIHRISFYMLSFHRSIFSNCKYIVLQTKMDLVIWHLFLIHLMNQYTAHHTSQ